MPAYSKAAQRWAEPLLALRAGGQVALRFLNPSSDTVSELGILAPGEGTFADYLAPRSYVRELAGDELEAPGAQFRQGAREVLLPDNFLRDVAAAQGQERVESALEAAAGLLIRGQLCRIKRFQPLETGDQIYAWQIFCDAPLEAG